jgi:hypothetical protein
MPSMSLRQGLNKNIKNLHRGAFHNSTPNMVQLFSEGGQPMSLKEQAGLIQGPGTGKSDSIDAKLPVKGFVLPVEVVQAIGPDKLQAMIDQFRGDSPNMDSEEVAAKVSNGEFFVPPEVVAKTGPEYWDSLVQQVTGSPAQPEISAEGVKAADGYGPNLATERQTAQQFWSQPNRIVAPVPGRANPANPADVMQDRLQASNANTQTQSQGLREQINRNLANNVQAPIQPTVQPTSLKVQAQKASAVNSSRQPAASYFNPPTTPGLKDQLLGAGNDIALATSLASDVLQAPHIAKNRDDAISGLKARAGFQETDTPFAYAEGGYVQKFLGGGQPQSEDELKKYQNDLAQRRPDLIAQGPMQPKPTTFQNMQQTLKDSSIAPTINAFGEGVKNAVKSGQQANQDYDALRQQGYGVIPAALKNSVDQYAKAGKAIGNVIEPAFSSLKSGVNNLYGIPSSDSQETQQPTQQPPSLKQAVLNPEQDKPKATQTNTPATTSLKEAVAQSEGVRNITGKPVQQLDDQGFYTVTGENGATAKVLDWNTTQNSLQQTMGADDYNRLQAQNQDYQNQRNNAVIGESSSFEKGKNGTFSRASKIDGFTPNTGLNLGKSGDNQTELMKLALEQQKLNQPEYAAVSQGEERPPLVYNKRDGRPAYNTNLTDDPDFIGALSRLQSGDEKKAQIGRDYLRQYYADFYTKLFGDQ